MSTEPSSFAWRSVSCQGAWPAFASASMQRPVGDVDSVERDRSFVGLDQSASHSEAGGLAGSVGTEESHNLTPTYLKAHPVHHASGAVRLDQALSG